MPSQARAIIWAQWRTLFHHLTRSKGNRNWFPIVVSVFWYGLWVLAAAGAAALTSDPRDHETAAVLLPYALLLAVFYWQAIPILMAATGVSLEMKKLVVYPIPHAQLFGLEVFCTSVPPPLATNAMRSRRCHAPRPGRSGTP